MWLFIFARASPRASQIILDTMPKFTKNKLIINIYNMKTK